MEELQAFLQNLDMPAASADGGTEMARSAAPKVCFLYMKGFAWRGGLQCNALRKSHRPARDVRAAI